MPPPSRSTFQSLAKYGHHSAEGLTDRTLDVLQVRTAEFVTHSIVPIGGRIYVARSPPVVSYQLNVPSDDIGTCRRFRNTCSMCIVFHSNATWQTERLTHLKIVYDV